MCRLLGYCSREWERQLADGTDSERYFLHLMARLAARGGDMVAAIADTTADISQRYTASSLNAILLAPDALYAISFYDRSMVPADLLRELGRADRPDEVAAYFDLAYRVTGDAVLAASSGWPMPGWTPLPSGHVLVTDRQTLTTSVLPITPSLPRPAGVDAPHSERRNKPIIPNGLWLHRPPTPLTLADSVATTRSACRPDGSCAVDQPGVALAAHGSGGPGGARRGDDLPQPAARC